uniref:Uncharacterized protein n=1 Tax=Arundo donax TaxID=35708 RepID=A0A0A9EY68_ARUDO
MRELVQKYGKRSSVQAHPWDDDDDDDIPEWNPNQQIRQPPLPLAPQQLPLPPPPLVQMVHPYHQQHYLSPNALQPQVPISPLPQAYLRTQQLPLQQQPNTWWPANGVAAAGGAAQVTNIVQQPQYGIVPSNSSLQGYDTGSVGGMAWRPR